MSILSGGTVLLNDKVYPTPEVVNVPISESVHDHLAKLHPSVFPTCVLTWAQAKKHAPDVDLSNLVCFRFVGGKSNPCSRAWVCDCPDCDGPWGLSGWYKRSILEQTALRNPWDCTAARLTTLILSTKLQLFKRSFCHERSRTGKQTTDKPLCLSGKLMQTWDHSDHPLRKQSEI